VDTATRSLVDAEARTAAPRAPEPNRRIARNLGALGGGQAVTWAVTLGWTFIVPRILGPAGIGVIVTATSVAGIFSILLGLGTRNYLVREIVVAPDAGPRLIGTALVLRIVMIPLFCVATVAYTVVTHTPHDQAIVIYLASAAALILLICEPYQSGFQAAEQMKYLAYGDVINKTGQSVVGVLLAVIGFRAIGITASWVAIALFVLVATHIWWSRISPVTIRTTPGELRRMLRGSAAYWAFGVFFLIYLWIDTVMLSLMTNPQTVGYYGVPTRLFQTMMFLPVLISTAWLPRLVQAFEEDPRHLRDAARRPVEVVLILGLPIGAATIIFAGPVISVLYGPAYHPAIGVMMLLGLCIPPIFLNILLNQVLIAAKRQSTWTWVMLGATIVNPLLNLALIPYTQTKYHNGALGAATSLVITEVLIVAVGLVLVGQHVITPGGVRRVVASAVASTAMVLAGLGMQAYGAVISIACGVAAFVIVGALVGLITPGKLRDARDGLAVLRARRDADSADHGTVAAHDIASSLDPALEDPMWMLDGVAAAVQPVEHGPVRVPASIAAVQPDGHDRVPAPDPAPVGDDEPATAQLAVHAAAPVPERGDVAGPSDARDQVPPHADAPVHADPVRHDTPPASKDLAVSVHPVVHDAVLAHAEAAATAQPLQDDPVRALELYRDATNAFRSSADRPPQAVVLENAAYVQCERAERALAAGDRDDARLAFGRALALARDAAALPANADSTARAAAEATAGRALVGLGQPLAALDHLKVAVLTARTTGDRRSEGAHLIDTARALDAAGRTRDGLAAARRAVHLLEEAGDRHTLGRALAVASALSETAGDLGTALAAERWSHRVSLGLAGEPGGVGIGLDARRAAAPRSAPGAALRPGAAMTDPVTGLPNRRWFDARLGELVANSAGPVALALFDLDCATRVNGGVSYRVRDDVVRASARVLRDSSRDQDVVARFDGEELAVVLPGTDLPGALTVCQRMRRAIAEYPWETVQPGLKVTASVGCVVGRPGATPADMLAGVDLQLCATREPV